MAASFPSVTVLISPEVVFTGMNSVNYLIRRYLVWSVNYLIREYLVWFLMVAGVGTDTKYFPMENDGSFVPQCYGVDIS